MWTRYWPIYERLEKEVCDFTFFVALNDAQLQVYSLNLAELILRICAECENVGKTLATELRLPPPAATTIERLNFPDIGNLLSNSIPFNTVAVEIVWIYQDLSNISLNPLSTWSPGSSKNPVWYDAYNGLKHNRNANIADANYVNTINALAALFILNLWLRKPELESHSEWIEFQKRRIESYSAFFSPKLFLKLHGGGTYRQLKLDP
jgi:hypothetical protein